MFRHSPSSALFRDACAQALALFCLVEGCLCSGTRPLPPSWGVPVLRHSPSAALLRGACAQALALFHLLGARLCLGTRPHPPCCACFPGLRHPVAVFLGTLSCAMVVSGGVPLWRASWPLVRSGRSRCTGQLSRRRGAFPHRVLCSPGFAGRLRGARGGRPRTRLIVPAASPLS